jgi:DNA mismatch endonuclease, patch repair protein
MKTNSDVMTPEQRLACMRRIQGQDTVPELRVEALLQRWGFAYEAQVRGLPGRPDFLLPERGLALLVHGCFWHRHHCPEGQPWPKRNGEFWRLKLLGNQERDRRNVASLRAQGWQVDVIWECETIDPQGLEAKLLALILQSGRNETISQE